MMGRRAERPFASRYYLGSSVKPARRGGTAADVGLARRAIRVLRDVDPLPDGHEYSPTDVLLPTRARPGVV